MTQGRLVCRLSKVNTIILSRQRKRMAQPVSELEAALFLRLCTTLSVTVAYWLYPYLAVGLATL